MGAATVMINAGRYHSVSFVVEDCGFDNFYELLVYLQKKERKYLNLTLMFFANIVFKVKTGKFLTDIAPIKYINTCDDIPMLFVHGLKDDFVPTYMAYRCYDFKNGNKKISLYEDCHHGECITNKFNDYKKDVTNFLKENNII